MMKTTNHHEQRIRYLSSREEAINRCLTSLIHALNCREGATCTAAGCQKMKRVVEHTRTCQRKVSSIRACPICSQLMSLCFYHSKLCRQSHCHVPFCRIMKRKLQSVIEYQAQVENNQSLKPVHQFVIPPILHAPPMSSPSSNSGSENNSTPEPSPKRMRLQDDEASSVQDETQHSLLINNEILAVQNAQHVREPATI